MIKLFFGYCLESTDTNVPQYAFFILSECRKYFTMFCRLRVPRIPQTLTTTLRRRMNHLKMTSLVGTETSDQKFVKYAATSVNNLV